MTPDKGEQMKKPSLLQELRAAVETYFEKKRQHKEHLKRKNYLTCEIAHYVETVEETTKNARLAGLVREQAMKRIDDFMTKGHDEGFAALEEILKEQRIVEKTMVEEEAEQARLAIKAIEDERKRLEKEAIDEAERRRRKREDLQKRWDDIRPVPEPLAGNRLVIENPYLGGYLCFYHPERKLEEYTPSMLLHRWIWQKANGRKIKVGCHIHHIDNDKYNNDPSNLQEVEGNEHIASHREV